MSPKEELLALRQQIDAVDLEMTKLFNKRMRVVDQVSKVKAQGNIAITDEKREQQVVDAAVAQSEEDMRSESATLMRTIIALSKLRETQKMLPASVTSAASAAAFPPSKPLKTGAAPVENIVAYQGVPGAWGEHAAIQFYQEATRQNYDYFEDVFTAVKGGKADYGVLPIENSQTGAIGEVYDLLRRHNCYIVGQLRITVAQCLLAVKGAALGDIREVYSHPEGFGQCRRFLKNKNWEQTACRNTAYAAQLVSEKNSPKFAAIGSRRAAAVYGLSVLAPDIMDNANNQTRFIAIAAEPIYDQTCDTTSITFSTAHKSGALCAVLQSFMLAGINLSRIESRPVSTDKYRFFADLQANLSSGATQDALRQAAMNCDYFEVLGCSHTLLEQPLDFSAI